MKKPVSQNVIHTTGIQLTPGEPALCLGNGEQGRGRCCHECDCYSLCFPEFELINKEKIKDTELPPLSKRHKIRMNRLFRERVGGSFLPFPEADCFYERLRSKIVVKLKINEFLDKCKERRRTR
ncbi:MAG: hypothetical protein IJO74_01345 [Clostridia bacterium]|nr:hypothetical protein [Clostridia bacterium]